MSEIIERAATAVSQVDFKLPGAGGLRGNVHISPAQSREIVRAVLQAIREPSEAMCEAASTIDLPAAGDIYGDGWVPPHEAPKVWQAMIDAALVD